MSDETSASINLSIQGPSICVAVSGTGAQRTVSVAIADPLHGPVAGGNTTTEIPFPDRSAAAAPRSPPRSPARSSQDDLDEALLGFAPGFSSRVPAAFGPGSLLPSHLSNLTGRLGDPGGLSPEARIRRHFNLGCEDRGLADLWHNGFRPVIPEASRLGKTAAYWFVVFIGPSHQGSRDPPVFYTHEQSVALSRTSNQCAGSIIRSFSTQAELKAYCFGTGLESLPPLKWCRCQVRSLQNVGLVGRAALELI